MKSITFAGALALTLLGGTAAMAQSASPAAGVFVQNAALGNEFEIAEAKIILQDSQDPQVRAFAQMMIHDHDMAQRDLDEAGMEAGTATRYVFDSVSQKKVDDLGLMDSPKLDQTYLNDQLASHAAAVASLGDYAVNGQDPALKHYARQTLPVVLHHKQMLEQMTGTNQVF